MIFCCRGISSILFFFPIFSNYDFCTSRQFDFQLSLDYDIRASQVLICCCLGIFDYFHGLGCDRQVWGIIVSTILWYCDIISRWSVIANTGRIMNLNFREIGFLIAVETRFKTLLVLSILP